MPEDRPDWHGAVSGIEVEVEFNECTLIIGK